MPEKTTVGGGLSTFGHLRTPNESEHRYFRENPHVSGMAAADNAVILNPYSKLTKAQYESVVRNERARLLMRSQAVSTPKFSLSPTQRQSFAEYSKNPEDVLATVAARILSGDPSAGESLPDQRNYVQFVLLPEMQRRGW